MSNQAIALTLFAIFVVACVVPAVLSGTAVRRLKGWTRGLAIPSLLIGLTAIPYIWLEPTIREGGRVGPDGAAFPALAMEILTAIVLLSTLIGFAVGAFQLHFHRRKPAEDGVPMLRQRF